MNFFKRLKKRLMWRERIKAASQKWLVDALEAECLINPKGAIEDTLLPFRALRLSPFLYKVYPWMKPTEKFYRNQEWNLCQQIRFMKKKEANSQKIIDLQNNQIRILEEQKEIYKTQIALLNYSITLMPK